MDTNMEDKMYHQIEKNLTNNINENLFASGKIYEKEKLPMVRNSAALEPVDALKEENHAELDYSGEAYEYMNQPSNISRAEFIRQAREACLRQLSSQSIRMMDAYGPESEEQDPALLNKKKARAMKLFKDSERALRSPWMKNSAQEEDSPQDIASFQSLVIRTVCAIVLFLSIFAVEKFDIKIGTFSKQIVREYVMGNDAMLKLEEIVAAWLK
jgi:DNA-binding transcriptional regulator YhcF (GntR family)